MLEIVYAATIWSMCCVTCPTKFEVKGLPLSQVEVRSVTTGRVYRTTLNEMGYGTITVKTPIRNNELVFDICQNGKCLRFSSASANVEPRCIGVS